MLPVNAGEPLREAIHHAIEGLRFLFDVRVTSLRSGASAIKPSPGVPTRVSQRERRREATSGAREAR
ncbi:hypothetical protein GCM10011372_28940 [Agromyces bauzanensis]|uniref:Uncharacterized protein n=1 Tax=Agromyces bauzanensis TaxID=1308924 RepID=A0A917PR39_9MICO|nr:hypothetical protein GCM10011372_28940 [Agromyces bauzanensis]